MIYGQFNDSYPPIMDGVANVVYNYNKYLNTDSSKCYVVTTTHPEADKNEDNNIKRFKSFSTIINSTYRIGVPNIDIKFKKNMQKINFDIIHTHNPFISGRLGLKTSREKGIPIISTFHSKYYDDLKNIVKIDSIAKNITNKIINYYNNVDYVWTVNEATKETLKDYGYLGEIDIIKNGTDINSESELIANPQIIDETFFLDANTKVLLYVGQIDYKKNLKFIIESIAKLRDKYTNFKLFMVGDGPDLKKLKAYVEKNNLSNFVCFTGLIKDRKLLKSFYARAYLFLFPSEYDTCGIVIKEASSLKLPSVILKDTNVSRDITNNISGFISKKNVLDYSNLIYDIIKNPSLKNKVGQGAYDYLYVCWADIVKEVRQRYDDIIKFHKRYKTTS